MLKACQRILKIQKGYKEIVEFLIQNDNVVDQLNDAFVECLDSTKIPIRAIRLTENLSIVYLPVRQFRRSFCLDEWYPLLDENLNWEASVRSIFKSLYGFSL